MNEGECKILGDFVMYVEEYLVANNLTHVWSIYSMLIDYNKS